MRKKKARHIIRDWLSIMEWQSVPAYNDTFEQDELADIIADALDLSEVDRNTIMETIKEMASKAAEKEPIMWNEPSKDRIPKLYETEDIPLQDKLIHLHFFIADCDWYVVEHEDGMFWGFVILNGDTVNAEWGYFGLEEMKEIKVNRWLEIDCESEYAWKVRKASAIDKIRETHNWLKG